VLRLGVVAALLCAPVAARASLPEPASPPPPSSVAPVATPPPAPPPTPADGPAADVAPAAPSRASAEPLDATKALVLSDGDDLDAKLPLRGKVKECCGYPIGLANFRLSFYWLAYESDYANEPYDTTLYTRDGYFLGRFPRTFVYELRLEGSGVLRDGRVLNYDGDCRFGVGTCFRTLERGEFPLGRGVQNRPLEPFRSIAVDPRYIPIGSPVFVPELVGLRLPDGTRHDGCLRADDQGGAIRLRKIDYFVESWFNYKYLAEQLWWRLDVTPLLDEPRCQYLRAGAPRELLNERADWAEVHSKKYQRALARAARANKRREVMASAGYRMRHRNMHASPAHGHAKLARRNGQ
jgi:3D (Asp-Asp-Asp) domain-containing protein